MALIAALGQQMKAFTFVLQDTNSSGRSAAVSTFPWRPENSQKRESSWPRGERQWRQDQNRTSCSSTIWPVRRLEGRWVQPSPIWVQYSNKTRGVSSVSPGSLCYWWVFCTCVQPAEGTSQCCGRNHQPHEHHVDICILPVWYVRTSCWQMRMSANVVFFEETWHRYV